MYAAEAAGLAWLAEPAALRTPAVVAVADERPPRFLALEWIDRGGPARRPRRGRSGGASPRCTGPARPRFGCADDSFIGEPARSPTPRRLAGPTSTASAASSRWPGGASTPARLRRAAAAGSRAPVRPARRPRRSARAAGAPARRPVGRQRHGRRRRRPCADRPGRLRRPPRGRPGHDAPFRRLRRRSSPPTTRPRPLADGHADRVALYQLYPLLVHVVLFGGGYGPSAERILRRYAG